MNGKLDYGLDEMLLNPSPTLHHGATELHIIVITVQEPITLQHTLMLCQVTCFTSG